MPKLQLNTVQEETQELVLEQHQQSETHLLAVTKKKQRKVKAEVIRNQVDEIRCLRAEDYGFDTSRWNFYNISTRDYNNYHKEEEYVIEIEELVCKFGGGGCGAPMEHYGRGSGNLLVGKKPKRSKRYFPLGFDKKDGKFFNKNTGEKITGPGTLLLMKNCKAYFKPKYWYEQSPRKLKVERNKEIEVNLLSEVFRGFAERFMEKTSE